MSTATDNWKVYLAIGLWSAISFIVVTWMSQFITGSIA